MAGLYSHTTRASGLVLTANIYNSDHQNHITNLSIDMLGITYTDAAYDATTDGQSGGSRSKPTSLQGQLERLAFAVKQIKVLLSPAITNWWETISSLTGDGSALTGIVASDTITNMPAGAYTVTTAQCTGRTTLTNAGAGASSVTPALPAGAANYVIHFNHVDSGDLVIDPNGTEQLVVDGTALGAGVALTSTKQGSRFTLVWDSSGSKWNVHYSNTQNSAYTALTGNISTDSLYATFASTGVSVTIKAGISGKIHLDVSGMIYAASAGYALWGYCRINRDSGTEYISLGAIMDTSATGNSSGNIAKDIEFAGLTPGSSHTFLIEWCKQTGYDTLQCNASSTPQYNHMSLLSTTW